MGNASKTLALLLTLIIAMPCLTLLTVKPVNAQIIPKPSVPDFTLNYVDSSYDVPSTTSTTTDPYTGKQTTTTATGYRIYNQSIYVSAKNQPFTPYNDSDGHYINLAYTIRWKGYYSDSWNYLPNRTAYYGVDGYWSPYEGNTTIVIGLNWKENPIEIHAINRDFDYDYFLGGVPVNGTVDFQVQAFIGYSELVPMPRNPYNDNGYYLVVTGQSSDWSSTQTITIPTSSISPSPNPTSSPTQTPSPTPTVPELSWLVIVPLLLSVFAVAVVVRHRKTSKLKP